MDNKLVLSVPEAGKLLSCSRATSYKLAHTGELPTIRLGRKLLVPRVQLERMLIGEGHGRDESRTNM